MTQRTWAVLGVLGALLVAVLVVGVKELVSKGESPQAAAPSPTTTGLAAPPPSAITPTAGDGGGTEDGTGGTGTAGGGGDADILGGSDVTAAHQAMLGYVQALGSYTSADRQASWEKVALAYTTGNASIRAFTRLPTGRSWAQCLQAHCVSASTARVLRDTATTNLPGTGALPQVVSYVDLKTTLTGTGQPASRQDTRFTITANEVSGQWKVSGCTFAGIGDSGGGS